MNSPQFGLRVAGTIFGLASVAHLVRLLLGFQVLLGSHPLPAWTSIGGFVVTGLLAFWLWRLSFAPAAPAAGAAPPSAQA
jgi:hypothetical protein